MFIDPTTPDVRKTSKWTFVLLLQSAYSSQDVSLSALYFFLAFIEMPCDNLEGLFDSWICISPRE